MSYQLEFWWEHDFHVAGHASLLVFPGIFFNATNNTERRYRHTIHNGAPAHTSVRMSAMAWTLTITRNTRIELCTGRTRLPS